VMMLPLIETLTGKGMRKKSSKHDDDDSDKKKDNQKIENKGINILKKNIYIFYVYSLFQQHHHRFKNECQYYIMFSLFLYYYCEDFDSVLALLSSASYLFPSIFQKYVIFFISSQVEEKKKLCKDEEDERKEDREEMNYRSGKVGDVDKESSDECSEESQESEQINRLFEKKEVAPKVVGGNSLYPIKENSIKKEENLKVNEEKDEEESSCEESDENEDFKVEGRMDGNKISVASVKVKFKKVLGSFLNLMHHLNSNSYNVHKFGLYWYMYFNMFIK
jgi:hypothetical protein